MKRQVICIDLDGVLAHYDGWKGEEVIGQPIAGAVRFTRAVGDFAKVLIHTSRKQVDHVTQWLDRHAFHYDDIWNDTGKPTAVAYVDDRAVLCLPERDPENYDFDRALRSCRALAAGHQLGSQGSYSDGRLNEDDEGDLKLMVSHDKTCVRVDFGKPVAWLAFPKEQAIQLAQVILKHAKDL